MMARDGVAGRYFVVDRPREENGLFRRGIVDITLAKDAFASSIN